MKWLALVVGVLGLFAAVAGVVYLTIPAHSLPSVLGPLPGVKAYRTSRGEAAIAAAGILFIMAGAILLVARGETRRTDVPGLRRLASIWQYLLGRGDG